LLPMMSLSPIRRSRAVVIGPMVGGV
jgi:hypothetical protein